MDLEKFFDTVSQSKLIEVLSRTIKDSRVISLIYKYFNAGVVANGKFERTEVGMPQGGPLSPLLSNVMLNELDKELERRGHKFVRYADDCMIFCKSKKKIKTKYRMLKALGLEHWKAKEYACSRKGYWRMAQVLNQIFSNKIIAKLGYTSMFDYYLIVYEN